jgi:hypothetical protein
MSEAELHVLQARLRGGILNKASRGELKMPLPVGLCYTEHGQVGLDPDQQVQQALRLRSDTFARTGSAGRTVRAFAAQGLLFPRRVRRGLHKGELTWGRAGAPPCCMRCTIRDTRGPSASGAPAIARRPTAGCTARRCRPSSGTRCSPTGAPIERR